MLMWIVVSTFVLPFGITKAVRNISKKRDRYEAQGSEIRKDFYGRFLGLLVPALSTTWSVGNST